LGAVLALAKRRPKQQAALNAATSPRRSWGYSLGCATAHLDGSHGSARLARGPRRNDLIGEVPYTAILARNRPALPTAAAADGRWAGCNLWWASRASALSFPPRWRACAYERTGAERLEPRRATL